MSYALSGGGVPHMGAPHGGGGGGHHGGHHGGGGHGGGGGHHGGHHGGGHHGGGGAWAGGPRYGYYNEPLVLVDQRDVCEDFLPYDPLAYKICMKDRYGVDV